MKKKVLAAIIILVLIRTIISVAASCLYLTIWVPAFASERVDYACSYRLPTPMFTVANIAGKISEERNIELYAPKSTDEAALVISEDGIYHSYIFIPYITYYTVAGQKFERIGDWLITPDRQLWFLRARIFMLEHRISNHTLTMARLYIFYILRVITVVMLGFAVWKKFSNRRTRQVEQ